MVLGFRKFSPISRHNWPSTIFSLSRVSVCDLYKTTYFWGPQTKIWLDSEVFVYPTICTIFDQTYPLRLAWKVRRRIWQDDGELVWKVSTVINTLGNFSELRQAKKPLWRPNDRSSLSAVKLRWTYIKAINGQTISVFQFPIAFPFFFSKFASISCLFSLNRPFNEGDYRLLTK